MSLADDLTKATNKVSKDWKKAKQKADKNDNVSTRSLYRMRYTPPARTTVREIAFAVMEEAYNKASANGQYYANARQIMYAARPTILQKADTDELKSVYFTQTLLKDYLEIYKPNWKVVWDPRGNLIEPHTREKVPLGGIGVAEYKTSWFTSSEFQVPNIEHSIATKGPENRYRNALFIEKEGFTEILSDAQIPETYDIALMSTKGIPTDAACNLISDMHAKGVKVFVLHDFDLSGFKIFKTLREGTRLSIGSDVIDLGLRLADIEDLQREDVTYNQTKDPRWYLEECGATTEERDILVQSHSYSRWDGERVEINAMASDQLINWLTKKFEDHKVEKLIPDEETITEAYRSARKLYRIEEKIAEIEYELEEDESPLPENLRDTIIEKMKNGSKTESWDSVVWDMAEEAEEE